MTTEETFFDDFIHSNQGKSPLQTASKWAKFIGIVFIFLSLTALLTLILMLVQQEKIASVIMDLNRMSPDALDFIMGGGKWIFSLSIIAAVSVMLMNAYWLIRFSTSAKNYIISGDENELQFCFSFLNKYIKITVYLGLLSLLVSLLAAAFSLKF